MIKNSEVVEYLRSKLSPTYAVDGAVSYFAATDKSRLPLPALYVSIGPIPGDSISDGDYLQMFTCNIRIRLVCLANLDRTGKYAQDLAATTLQVLIRVLANKKLNKRYNETYYVNADFEGLDEARYIHYFDFAFTGIIDNSDLEDLTAVELAKIHVDYNLAEASIDTQPNAQDIVDTFD